MTHVIGQTPLRYPVADQVTDLRVRVVCMSQAGRKMVESQLRTGLRPGSSYLDISIARTCLWPGFDQKKSWAGRRPAWTCR